MEQGYQHAGLLVGAPVMGSRHQAGGLGDGDLVAPIDMTRAWPTARSSWTLMRPLEPDGLVHGDTDHVPGMTYEARKTSRAWYAI